MKMKRKIFLTVGTVAFSLTAFTGKHVAKSLDERVKLIAPVPAGELRVLPTFNSAGIVFGCPEKIDNVKLEYRPAGTNALWLTATAPVYDGICRNYRGSVMHLDEDTEYEIRIGGKTASFRTWKSQVPIARTIVVDPKSVKFPLVIDAKGDESGWIRYTASGKLVNPTDELAILVDGASHVVFDDMVIEGGAARNVFRIVNSDSIRIRNCEMSKWGRVGRHNYDDRGRICVVNPDGTFGPGINYDPAVIIGTGTERAVVERCYIHDPNGTSVSWLYCHPAGPEAVLMEKPNHSTVLRWNDFVGSDVHRWNDAVEGAGNFHEDGGFNRNADINGNFMFCANDDCIELDGGQQNVRSFENRYECAFCGVSVQGCVVGPSYLANDLFVNIVDENDRHGQTVKTSSFDRFGWGSTCFLSGLVAKGRCSPPATKALPFKERFVQRDCKYLEPLADREWFANPVRPAPFELDVGRIGGIRVANGVVAPQEVRVRVIGKGAATPFAVRVNDAIDWMKVTPASGVVESGREVVLTVAFDAAKMVDRRHFRGAFLVRAQDGLSRACTVDAVTDYLQPKRPDPRAVYVELEQPVKMKPGEWLEYEFEVPECARYMIAVHGHARDRDEANVRFPRMSAAVDNDKAETYDQYCSDYPCWSLVVPGCSQNCRMRYYELSAGKHRLRLRLENRSFVFDGLAITRDPEKFKPR